MGVAHLETLPKEAGESAMKQWEAGGKSNRGPVSGKAENSLFSEGKRAKVAGAWSARSRMLGLRSERSVHRGLVGHGKEFGFF